LGVPVNLADIEDQAQRAEEAADVAESEEERMSFLHIAEVWREMAENLRRQTEGPA